MLIFYSAGDLAPNRCSGRQRAGIVASSSKTTTAGAQLAKLKAAVCTRCPRGTEHRIDERAPHPRDRRSGGATAQVWRHRRWRQIRRSTYSMPGVAEVSLGQMFVAWVAMTLQGSGLAAASGAPAGVFTGVRAGIRVATLHKTEPARRVPFGRIRPGAGIKCSLHFTAFHAGAA